VHRVLARHCHPTSGGTGPSWLPFIGHTTDSLWSVDLFRCESIVLQTYWVLVVMDQFTRRLVGLGVHRGAVTGADVCRMFNAAIHGQGAPRHLSTDHDPLFEAHRWKANLRILEIDEVKTVPDVPLSHPFVERLIGTMRREFLDHVLFWNARDLERKLAEFQVYYKCDARPRVVGGPHAVSLHQWVHGGPCRSELCPLGLSLQGPRPAPSRRLITNSRPTRQISWDFRFERVFADSCRSPPIPTSALNFCGSPLRLLTLAEVGETLRGRTFHRRYEVRPRQAELPASCGNIPTITAV
jgi:transposase InsO family protein